MKRSSFAVPEPFLFPARCTDAAEKGKVAFFRRSLQKFSAGGAVAVVDVVVHISTVVEWSSDRRKSSGCRLVVE